MRAHTHARKPSRHLPTTTFSPSLLESHRANSARVRQMIQGSPGKFVAIQRKPPTAEQSAVDLESAPFRDNPRLQAAFDNAPTMSFGERGEAVRRVQKALVGLGFAMPVSTQKGTQEPDGIFGRETFRTVKAFQRMQGITKDGIVGRETLGELDGRITGTRPPGTPSPFTVPPGGPVTVTAVDRSPQQFEACAGGFGRFHWEVAWETNARNGYIVQEMESAQEGTSCDGTPDPGIAPAAPLFWEAWRVQQDGQVHPPHGTDTWQVPVDPFHRGIWRLTGKVFFVEQLDPRAGFRTGNVAAPQAGSLYATAVRPGNLGPVLLTRRAAGHWECCGNRNVHEPLVPPTATLPRADAGQALSETQSEVPSQREAFVETQAVPSPGATCLPGYTQCDFLDKRTSVPGQLALYELYKRGGEECANALALLSAVRSEAIQGIYKADEKKPAMMAIRHRTTWWDLVPPGQGAVVFKAESPPMVVFRESLAMDRKALGTALNDAWKAAGHASTVIVPLSLKPCPLSPPPEPEPTPLPGPEPKRECPPGTLPDPSGELCILPGKIVPECTDAEMDSAFQKQKDFCASIKMGLDLLCELGANVCDTKGPGPKAICNIYEKIFGKPIPRTKPPECSEPEAVFYEKCVVGTMVGERPNMSCSPGKIRERYRRWPGRVK